MSLSPSADGAVPDISGVDGHATLERTSREATSQLLRELRTSRTGLTAREAQRRLQAFGRNVLPPAPKQSWVVALGAQLGHPLALLLWAAAGLSLIAGTPALAGAIVAVILLNAVFALVQERQAQRAVEALSAYLPSAATAVRDAGPVQVDAADLVPGDIVLLEEGARIPADGRLLDGALQVDMSALTGESAPVERVAGRTSTDAPLLSLPDLVFSGTLCAGGSGTAVVIRTGRHSEIGRIAALTHRVPQERSPLEEQVRRVAWLIAGVGVGVGVAFLPLGLLAGLSLRSAVVFAVGLLVANVPEGLLPTITLALASSVRSLARHGAVVKRLSAIETLGCTSVICTDKTGTLTQNAMHPAAAWTPSAGQIDLVTGDRRAASATGELVALRRALAGCSVVRREAGVDTAADPTDLGLEELLRALGGRDDVVERDATRRRQFRFDPDRRLSSTVQEESDGAHLYVKGAPEEVLARSSRIVTPDGADRPLDAADHELVLRTFEAMTRGGLRVIAVGGRTMGATLPEDRDSAERDLTFLGLAALHDPPRPEVAHAVADCHAAGIRIHIVTGDNGNTAAHVARDIGLGHSGMTVIDGVRLEHMPESALDELLSASGEIVFARSAPEVKLRIADALRDQGQVVAMTGDGVNDAPALRRADIGVAMGRAGTEVAREAATMVLTDDNFATLVQAVRAGRQVFDNVRKFILYIFAHTVPEVLPFLVFALSGGAVPLPLTVMQILAIDLGTETLPALALGREQAEPGIMQRRPRRRSEGVITRELLIRAWGFLGVISAALVLLAYFFVLWRGGWHAGADTGSGSALHQTYVQATTAAWAGLVSCQIGTAFAARTERASLRAVGVISNRLLLWGIAFEIAFAAALIYVPGLDGVFDMTPPPATTYAVIAPFPLIVWGADEIRRWRRRRSTVDLPRSASRPTAARVS